ncbi:MAG: AraC family transcriptional regulator [Alistipes sp.]|nr:AraC family transcriptional regulator [Alistipes sp.]
MKNFIDHINLSDKYDAITIGDDLSIFSFNASDTQHLPKEPQKLSQASIAICTSGSCHIKINLQEYEVESPMLLALMPGQIIEAIGHSQNFAGYAIMLSRRFVDMLNLPGWQQQYMMMYNNPLNKIDSEKLTAIRIFFAILYRAASNEENPFRLQVIENLIRVFYYGGVHQFKQGDAPSGTPKNSIVERFIALVEEHYREERLIGFYADKLCITPKYLSKLVKENTGRSAGEWIESHVILEARAMLQSSDMTIQQIATSLNFPNQSFFGKYFKRATGLSPKQYRHGGDK